jgi:hypothetical protein
MCGKLKGRRLKAPVCCNYVPVVSIVGASFLFFVTFSNHVKLIFLCCVIEHSW